MAKKKPDGPASAGASQAPKPYVVLARKYRPESFDDLIGQEAMVRTLRNAFAADRIAQGYMLTGVRGVGKTTTARILARGLNYARDGKPDRPTVDLKGYGIHCADIIASRHPDVIEMDAASNTGVDNVREIIESARYRPMLARYKVFIIDEVHMLSKGAFNALLKTLEEPPEHVKFIFATTEVRKVPVTILSRCQRFDLKRVEPEVLTRHFAKISQAEGAVAEPEALALIARAAQGSVRDGLSILDQAIAFGEGRVAAGEVRDMLGLADRGRILDLLAQVLEGDAKGALSSFEALVRDGAEPGAVLEDAAAAVHELTRFKATGTISEDLASADRERCETLAQGLTLAKLSRLWSMLLKGLEETARAPDPRTSAEMVLIRLCYAADLPPPDELARLIGGGSAKPATSSRASAPSPGPAPSRAPAGSMPERSSAAPPPPPPAPPHGAPSRSLPRSFEEVVGLVSEQRDARLLVHLEEHVRLLKFDGRTIELALEPGAPAGLVSELSEKLKRWTGERWIIAVGRGASAPTLGEVRRRREAEDLARLKDHPAMKAVGQAFPGHEIKAVRPLARTVAEDDDAPASDPPGRRSSS